MKRELRNLLNRAAAALETPGDLTAEDRKHLVEDLTIAALRPSSKRKYNEHFDANEQIELEESIASQVMQAPDERTEQELADQALGETITPYPEELCQRIGRSVLYRIVTQLRPDLLCGSRTKDNEG